MSKIIEIRTKIVPITSNMAIKWTKKGVMKLPVISKKMEKYVKSFPEKVGYTDEQKSKNDRRLIEYATIGIKNLALIATKLPENMQAKIFNEENLMPLFRALFQVRELNSKISEENRLRMLTLCNCALDEIKIRSNAVILAPNAWKVLKETSPSSHLDDFYGTKAIQAIQIEYQRF